MVALRHADLKKFFSALARRLPSHAKLILTGGSEAMLLGGRRPTGDLDFSFEMPDRKPVLSSKVEAAIAAAAQEAGVAVQYSADIDRWSQVSVPKAKTKTRFYKRFGPLTIHLLDPKCWAVYKLARYLDSDVEDLVSVLKHQRVSWIALARLCGQCLRLSPRSTQLHLFRRQVEHFFKEHGGKVWGKTFKSERAIAVFHRTAKIHSP
jgi:hypothetical protein